MEQYAVKRLMRIFKHYDNGIKPDFNKTLSETIVDALIQKTQCYDHFKTEFWKILWNLKIKGAVRSKKTLDDLFHGKWKTVEHFINASHDELDDDCANFRANVRLKEFHKIENTKKINALLDEDIDHSCSQFDTGLVCSRCKSNKTTYNLYQIRRSDEGSTSFCLCLSCGHRWKFS